MSKCRGRNPTIRISPYYAFILFDYQLDSKHPEPKQIQNDFQISVTILVGNTRADPEHLFILGLVSCNSVSRIKNRQKK